MKSERILNDKALKIPRVQAINPRIPEAIKRLVFNDSTNHATPGSRREIAELSAAILNSTKNNLPNITHSGIFTKAQGKVTKTKPGPDAGSKLLAKTIGKIAIPARIATVVSRKATESAVEPMFCLAGI